MPLNKNSEPFNHSRGQEFLDLYVIHERRIYSYILTLVHDWSISEDILQETARVMLMKFNEFESGTNFLAWALCIARYQVMDYQKRQNSKVMFDSELVDLLEQEINDCHDVDEQEHDALKQCLKKLNERDKYLIELRYDIGSTVKSIAERVGRSANAVYHSLNRIHCQLLQCVLKTLARESHV